MVVYVGEEEDPHCRSRFARWTGRCLLVSLTAARRCLFAPTFQICLEREIPPKRLKVTDTLLGGSSHLASVLRTMASFRPLGLWDPFQMTELHGLYMGGLLTTSNYLHPLGAHPPSSQDPGWRDACERSLGTHRTPSRNLPSLLVPSFFFIKTVWILYQEPFLLGKKLWWKLCVYKKVGTYYNPDVATIFVGEGCDGFTGKSETRERREGAQPFGVRCFVGRGEVWWRFRNFNMPLETNMTPEK